MRIKNFIYCIPSAISMLHTAFWGYIKSVKEKSPPIRDGSLALLINL
jgi:hypothetical protein